MHTIYTLAVAVLFGWWRRWICTHTIYKAVITMFIVTDNLHFKALRWWTGNKNLFKAKVALVIWMAKLIYVPLSKYSMLSVYLCFISNWFTVFSWSEGQCHFEFVLHKALNEEWFISVLLKEDVWLTTLWICKIMWFIYNMPIWSFILHWTTSNETSNQKVIMRTMNSWQFEMYIC